MTIKSVLKLAAVFEGVTGGALLVNPSAVTSWLVGDELSPSGKALGHVTGFALIALGLACWPHGETRPAATSVWAMLMYSLLVAIYLGYYGVNQPAGPLLWPAVAIHAVLPIFLVAAWSREGHVA